MSNSVTSVRSRPSCAAAPRVTTPGQALSGTITPQRLVSRVPDSRVFLLPSRENQEEIFGAAVSHRAAGITLWRRPARVTAQRPVASLVYFKFSLHVFVAEPNGVDAEKIGEVTHLAKGLHSSESSVTLCGDCCNLLQIVSSPQGAGVFCDDFLCCCPPPSVTFLLLLQHRFTSE